MSDLPRRVNKPWGHELIWAHTDRYIGKILHVNAGGALSVQYHHKKDETMYVLSGELLLRTWASEDAKPEERIFKAGESVRIPPPTIHQIEALVDSDVLEASSPEIDDLVRLTDKYGRA